jgi:hypothetical protein
VRFSVYALALLFVLTLLIAVTSVITKGVHADDVFAQAANGLGH